MFREIPLRLSYVGVRSLIYLFMLEFRRQGITKVAFNKRSDLIVTRGEFILRLTTSDLDNGRARTALPALHARGLHSAV